MTLSHFIISVSLSEELTMSIIKPVTMHLHSHKPSWLFVSFLQVLAMSLFFIAPVSANPDNEAQSYDTLLPYFYAAARTGDNEVITEFLNAGLPIDIKNKKGYTALMIATYHGRKKIVNSLIKQGANVCMQDNRGNTALMAAVFRGEFSIAKTLMSEDCDSDQQNKAGQTAVMYATLFGRKALRDLLVNRGADLNLQDNSGHSAISIEQSNNR